MALRDAGWLDATRIGGYLRLFGAAYLLFLVAWAWRGWAGAAPGKPLAHDFIAFWSAGRLALNAHASGAYDTMQLRGVEAAAAVLPGGLLPFYYPPPFLLVCAALALLPYVAALPVFVAAELLLLLALLRRILPRPTAWLALLTWPGFLLAALVGQNTPLTAACFAGAVIWLESRPALAGICLGCLVCKPQFGIGIPIALLAARRFKALGACAGFAACLCLTSCLAFGIPSWRAFLGYAPHAFAQIQFDTVAWHKMQSLFGALRLAGAGIGTAYAAQACVSVLALAALGWLCAMRPGGGLEMAFLAAASLLLSPYLYYYDLAVLSVPAAWLAFRAGQQGWLPWEKLLLLGIFVLPLLALGLSMALGLLVGPLFVVAILLVLARRAAPPDHAMADRICPL